MNLFRLARGLSRDGVDLFFIAPETFCSCLLAACGVSSGCSLHGRLCGFSGLGGAKSRSLALWSFDGVRRGRVSMVLLGVFAGQLEWRRLCSCGFLVWFGLGWPGGI